MTIDTYKRLRAMCKYAIDMPSNDNTKEYITWIEKSISNSFTPQTCKEYARYVSLIGKLISIKEYHGMDSDIDSLKNTFRGYAETLSDKILE